MYGTKSMNSSTTFNLALSIKNFVISRRQFDENFGILTLYGAVNPISKLQDVPISKDTINVYYRHHLAGKNVSGKMQIQSSSMIAQMKHATSSFKQYLLKDRVHINNAQLGTEEAVADRDIMREAMKEQMPIEYNNVERALFPKKLLYQVI
jgi:hypothetical protein